MVNRLPEGRIVEIITNAVEIEKEFVSDALPVELIGMNSSLMCEYIEFCAASSARSDAGVTTKLGIHSNGWKRSVYRERQTSLKNVLENTRNRVLELTAQIKPLPFLTPVSNGKRTNTHKKHTLHRSHQHYPLSHRRLLPRLYENEHQTCEQRSQYSPMIFRGKPRTHQALSGSVMIN